MAGAPAWLRFGVVLHRGLQCEDEAASEEELLSHVLWYHPSSHGPLERLKQLSLVEGVIALAAAVSGGEDKLDAVEFAASRWVFSLIQKQSGARQQHRDGARLNHRLYTRVTDVFQVAR